MVLTLVSCHALCTSRLFVELLTVRWGELKGYVDKPINSSFSMFLDALLKLLRFASAPLFFIFDLFSLKGWRFLDTIGDKIRDLINILTSWVQKLGLGAFTFLVSNLLLWFPLVKLAYTISFYDRCYEIRVYRLCFTIEYCKSFNSDVRALQAYLCFAWSIKFLQQNHSERRKKKTRFFSFTFFSTLILSSWVLRSINTAFNYYTT